MEVISNTYARKPRESENRKMEGHPVNKHELIEAVAKKTKLTKRDASAAVDAALEAIKKSTKKGVAIAGFGSFSVSNRKARTGRNPRTGRAISIKASLAPVFRAGRTLKQLVNHR